ncbi:MAG: helix-turn-helix domain-containing protein [Aestuariivirga sp.]
MGLAENIKVRRSAKSYSQAELAESAGVSQQLINALENGKVGSTKFMPEIAAALGCTVRELDPRFGNADRPKQNPSYVVKSASELPILAAKEMPPVSMSVEISVEPVDFMDRPPLLENVRDGYALFVADDLMSPELERGDMVLVNPHFPPIPNTTCILLQESGGARIGKVRRLLGFTADEWHVKMWNGPVDSVPENSLNRQAWQLCHRIVARYCRR